VRQAARAYHQPLVYRVGEDISHERYNECIAAIGDWFAKSRKTTEPVALAREALHECLEGKTKAGNPWYSAARSTLAARVRSKCRFDIDEMKPLEKATPSRKAQKKRDREATSKKRKATKHERMVAEVKEIEAQRSNPTSALVGEEKTRWDELRRAYIRQFPEELSTVAAQAELETLCDLHILTERQRADLLSKRPVDYRDRESVSKQFNTLKKNLGIHPEQLAKRVKEKTDTTIGAAVAKLTGMGDDWRDLRKRFWAEELIQILQMYHTPRADGITHHLDEVGLFGMTKCRTCECAKCGIRNFVGISEPEIVEYLKKEGHIREVDPADPDALVPEADEEWEDEDESGWEDEASVKD